MGCWTVSPDVVMDAWYNIGTAREDGLAVPPPFVWTWDQL